MFRGKAKAFLFIAVLILGASVPGFFWYKSAASQAATPIDWTGLLPTITKISDLTAAPQNTNRDCTKTSLQINRGTSAPFEEHCLVPSVMGLIESQGQIVQPNGYTKGYPVSNRVGSATTLPIPNQPGALALTGTSSNNGSAYLQYYRGLHSNLQFEMSLIAPRFDIIKPPDDYFRYGDRSAAFFNYPTLSYSYNGRFIMVDTIYNGFAQIDIMNLTMRPVADSLPILYNGFGTANTATDTSGKFTAVAFYRSNDPTGTRYFKIINVGACSGQFNADNRIKPVFTCPTVDMRPKVAQVVPNLQDIFNVRFVNSRTVTFVTSSGTAPSNYKYARYSMTAGGQQTRLVDYLAIGDSYISGEGAHSYRLGTDTERNGCHQSLLSYPYLLSQKVNSFASLACSGAKMHNIAPPIIDGNKEYQLKNGVTPSAQEIDMAYSDRSPGFIFQRDFVERDNPEAVTISIGGNDIGFASILEKCVHPFKNLIDNVITDHTCYSTYEDRLEVANAIKEQLPRLRQLYKGLRNGGTETRRVYVVGYPQVAKVGGNCGLNVQMNASEIQFAHELIAYLDSVIKQAADEAGVVYVDTQNAFDGSRLCEGLPQNSSMNGFTVGKNSAGKIDVAASFHPNKAGHQKLASVVAIQTDDLTKPMPEPTFTLPGAINIGQSLLQGVVVTNRTVRRVQMVEPGEKLVQIGSLLGMTFSGREFFTKPGGIYDVVLGTTATPIGRVTADSGGTVIISSMIPATTKPGFQTVHLYGNDVFGQPIDIQSVIYIAATPDDYDRDGLGNELDSCPLSAQSGIDMDIDGVDDVCDTLVTALPVVPPEPEGIIWRDDAVLSVEIQATSGQ